MRIKKSKAIFTKEKGVKAIVCVIIFSVAVILKFGYYRFSYFPILDDYIQYGSYHLFPKSYVLFDIGTIYIRPFAALCDIYLWGFLRDNLSVIFIIITIMHLASAFLFKKAFKDIDIHLGNVFLVFYLLSPVLSEALYWISASSRIVPGLLFCALSINFIGAYLKSKKLYLWILAFITHFISYGFYEQTICLSFAVFVFFIFMYSRSENRLNISALTIPVICAIAFLSYYIICSNLGSLPDRTEISISFSQMFGVAKRLFRIFTVQNFELTANGFVRGLKLLLGSPIYLVFVFLTSAMFLFMPRRHFSPCSRKLILCVIILVSSYIPYFIIKCSYPEFRSMYTAVFALGLALDCIGDKFRIRSVLCTVLAFVFLTANVSEIHDYKAVYYTDQRIINEITSSGKLSEHTDIYVTGAKDNYTQLNSRLGSHISGITSSEWALTGAVRARTKNANIKRLIPVYEDSIELYPQISIPHQIKVEMHMVFLYNINIQIQLGVFSCSGNF